MRNLIVLITLASFVLFAACTQEKAADTTQVAATSTNSSSSVTSPAPVNAAPVTPPASAPAAAVSWEGNGDLHDFGQIPQSVPATHRFEFTNNGDSPLTISNVKPSCGCTAANYTTGSILPGQKGFVEATYNAASPGVFSKAVTVRFGDEYQPISLKLKGEVNAAK
ncbi:MAG: DUF1573 domain-containing protein [Bacteroidota bacterium]